MSNAANFVSSVRPQGASSIWSDEGTIEAITRWCEYVQGRQPLLATLRHFADLLGAKAVCLSRHSRASLRVAQAVAYNAPDVVASCAEATRSFAHCVLGIYLDKPRVGSLWLSSLADERNDPALKSFQVKAEVAETAVIPLAIEDKRIDYLEIHLAAPLARQDQTLLERLAEGLSRVWASRANGLFSEAVLSKRERQRLTFEWHQLLSPANPCDLSRCEFRICLLLSRGLNRASVCDELSISAATLRTHLRSIYRKTGAGSEAELLFALLAPGRTTPAGLRPAASDR